MVTPTRPEHKKGTIIKKEMISPTVAHFTIDVPGTPAFKAGQFCWVTYEQDGEQHKRPYSIASAPWEERLALCIKRIPEGKVSGLLVDLEPKAELDIFSPMGLFTLPENTDKEDYLFIGVGTGIAPYRSMIRTLFKKYYGGEGEDTKQHVALLFGARNKEEVLYQEEFEQLAKERKNFKYHITLSREDAEGKLRGYVQHHIETVLHNPMKTNVFICGLKPMVIEVNKALQEKGVPKQHIHEELY